MQIKKELTPKEKFEKLLEKWIKQVNDFGYISRPITTEKTKEELDSNIFSLALTRKNYVNYSKLKQEDRP